MLDVEPIETSLHHGGAHCIEGSDTTAEEINGYLRALLIEVDTLRGKQKEAWETAAKLRTALLVLVDEAHGLSAGPWNRTFDPAMEAAQVLLGIRWNDNECKWVKR